MVQPNDLAVAAERIGNALIRPRMGWEPNDDEQERKYRERFGL